MTSPAIHLDVKKYVQSSENSVKVMIVTNIFYYYYS